MSFQKKNKKVLLVTNIPNPYRIPLFNEIHKQLKDLNTDFLVAFGAKGYKRRKWNLDMQDCQFKYVFLSGLNLYKNRGEKSSFTYTGVVRLILKYQPDIVITNSYSIATTKLFFLSLMDISKYLIWSAAVEGKDVRPSRLRLFHRRQLVKRSSGFIAYGTKAKEYLVSLGADENKTHIGINTVDLDHFVNTKNKIRNDKGLIHLLYVGHLSPRKNVLKLLKVIKKLTSMRNNFVLDIVGDGEDRIMLENFVKENKLNSKVHFHGFKQKSELTVYFDNATCFLFQTDSDVWGLVLNEAMAAALPCYTSIHAAASYDLVQDGNTGFIIDFAETTKIAELLNKHLMNPAYLKQIGENAKQFIFNNATIKISAAGFVKAICTYFDSNNSARVLTQ